MAAPATQPIGTRYGVKGNMWAAGHHTGVDYLCPVGSTLKAPVGGKILHAGANSSTGWGAAYGIHVIGESVIAGKTYRWMTAHMSAVSVRAGQSVKVGDVLGKSGATGNVTGPHCHFEVRVSPFSYGHDVDPTIASNAKAAGGLAQPSVAVWAKPETFVLGATGADVVRLGNRLVVWAKALKLPVPYKTGPSSPFTATDQKAIEAFQKAQGWTGADADGFPGAETLKRLAADPPAAKPAKAPAARPANATAPKALPAGMASMYHVPAGTWYAIEDSLLGVETANALGFKWIDMDCHVTKDGVWVFGHWSEMTKDGYTLPAAFVKKYGKKPLIENVTWADLQTLRTPVTTWRGKKVAAQYVDAATVFAWLAKHPTMSVAMEMKGAGNALSPGFTNPETFRRLQESAVAAGIDPAKRLLVMSQPPWSNLLPAFKAAHPYFRTAIQRLSWKKPANWAQVEPYVDYYRSGNWGTKTR